MPAKQIPDAEVEALLRAGLSLVQVSEWLGRERDIHVTPNAIGIWRRRRGEPRIRPASPVELVPWTIDARHRYRHILNMLRAEARLRRGEELPTRAKVAHRNWMATLQKDDLVVDYDPDTEDGFRLVPRRPGVDTDLVRVPEKITAPPVANDRDDNAWI